MQQWFIDNGLQVATLLTMVVILVKGSRWTGIMETKITNLEGWFKSHIANHPGKSE